MKTTQSIFWLFLVGATLWCVNPSQAQTTEMPTLPVKVKHIEPLYIDLIRDLGARKGEKELNLAGDFVSTPSYNEYAVLAEYEWAPINRVGFEIETDFSFYKGFASSTNIPGNRLDNLRLSVQYSFLVAPQAQTTLALAYTQVFNFADFEDYDNEQLVTGLVYSPFLIAAKNWGNDFYTLLLTGPLLSHDFGSDATEVDWQINASFHYGIPTTDHFIGIEFNSLVEDDFELVMRPQGKLQVNEALAIGLVAGIPITKSEDKFSSFFRVIYELE